MSIDTINTKKKMIEALEACLGIVSYAVERVGIHRTTHYLWMNNDAEYRAAVESVDDIVVDMSESALHHKIKEGDTTAIIFHLKTKGKRRGYIERSELKIEQVYEGLSEDELREKLADKLSRLGIDE